MTPATAIGFLDEAARYFEQRPINGEDAAHWANAHNAEICRQIADLIRTFEDALAASARANVLRFAAEADLQEARAVLREMFVGGPVQVALAGNPIACERLEARARAIAA